MRYKYNVEIDPKMYLFFLFNIIIFTFLSPYVTEIYFHMNLLLIYLLFLNMMVTTLFHIDRVQT